MWLPRPSHMSTLIHKVMVQSSLCLHSTFSTAGAVNVFDMETKVKQRNRQARIKRLDGENGAHDAYSYLKDEVAYRLADRILDIKRTFPKTVEWGCDYGFLTKHLSTDNISKLYLCDTAKDVLSDAKIPPEIPHEKIHLTDNLFPFEENSIDMVVSSLRLHWVNDLPGLFLNIFRGLKRDGCFLGVMFGGDTLFELRVALQLADQERQGGLVPRISPFTDNRDLGGLLTGAGFNLVTLDVDEVTIHYPSMFELLSDLRGMGETNCAWNRHLRLNQDVMLAAAAIYANMFGKETDFESHDENNDESPPKIERRFAVPATFQLLHFIAWKPDPSQSKPAKRGSGQVSIADVGELDRMIKEAAKTSQKKT